MNTYFWKKCFKTWIKGFILKPRRLKDVKKVREIIICKENIELNSCSNIILHIKTATEDGYLCECRKHLPIKQYVHSIIDDYYRLFVSNQLCDMADKIVIINSLKDRKNFRRFIRIGKSSLYSDEVYTKYLHTRDAQIIGLDIDKNNENQKERIKFLVEKFIWPELVAYYSNQYMFSSAYQIHTTCKVQATKAIANLLGLSDMVPPCEYVRVKVKNANNIEILGNFMKKAKGICAMDISPQNRRSMLTPEFQRAMSCMNLLDIICHEQDHSPNNYNVILDEKGYAVGVSVFDNNGASTFSLDNSICYQTYKNNSVYLNLDGTINRPHIDKATAKRIKTITKKELEIALKPYFRKPIINSTWKRLNALKHAIEITENQRSDFLLEKEEFSEKTIENELSGAYGKTYLISFLKDCQFRTKY